MLGEFYWRVAAGETVATDDYVRPGWMLSREANGEEISWTLAELLDPKEMNRAFGVPPPERDWPPMPHQPSPYGPLIKVWGKIGLGAIAFLLLLSLVFGGHTTLLEQAVSVPMDGKTRTATLGPITVNRCPPDRLDGGQRARASRMSGSISITRWSTAAPRPRTTPMGWSSIIRAAIRTGPGPRGRSKTIKIAAVPPAPTIWSSTMPVMSGPAAPPSYSSVTPAWGAASGPPSAS